MLPDLKREGFASGNILTTYRGLRTIDFYVDTILVQGGKKEDILSRKMEHGIFRCLESYIVILNI